MKKSILLMTGMLVVLMLSGCVKFYKDVETDEYATYEMTTKGSPFHWNSGYVVWIYDYSKGCKDMIELGVISAGFGAKTDIKKLPVEIPLLLKVEYSENKGANRYVDYTNFILTPEKSRHYVVEYERKEVNDQVQSEYHVYMQNGDKAVDIPSTRIREFNNRDCM